MNPSFLAARINSFALAGMRDRGLYVVRKRLAVFDELFGNYARAFSQKPFFLARQKKLRLSCPVGPLLKSSGPVVRLRRMIS